MSLQIVFVNSLAPNIASLMRNYPQETRQAIGIAGLALIQDAGSGRPRKPPIETGNLRASWFVYAGSDGPQGLVSGSGGQSPVPQSIPGSADTIQATVGYNAPYAVFQHEKLRPKGTWYPRGKGADDGSVGSEWLAQAMERNAARYAEVFASRLRQFLARRQQ